MLTQEYKGISEKENSAEKLIIKEQLLKTVQKELKLDVEMNELISSK
jgi:hypothetical protein